MEPIAEIYKLDPNDVQFHLDISEAESRLVYKINELVETINLLVAAHNETVVAEAIKQSPLAIHHLHPLGAKMYAECESESSPTTIVDVLNRWRVAFYDDVPSAWESPVYCTNCEYRSQSLLDRMMLNPDALCAGCAYKSANG